MRNSILACAFFGLPIAACQAPPAAPETQDITRIVIAGDSTAADYPQHRAPQSGWGQALPFFLRADVAVLNLAVNGRSTKSYIDEGRWDALVVQIGPGDLVMISFGHNDSRDDAPARYAAPFGDYTANLERFIQDVRSAGALPIIVSPAARRLWEGPAMVETHGLYAMAAQQAAEAANADFLDLSNLSLAYFERLGREETKQDYFWITRRHRDTGELQTLEDNTHFTFLGACGVANVIAQHLPDGLTTAHAPMIDAQRPESVVACAAWMPRQFGG